MGPSLLPAKSGAPRRAILAGGGLTMVASLCGETRSGLDPGLLWATASAASSPPPVAPTAQELHAKEAQVHALLARRKLDALLLRRVSSFAWATGGAASYINTAVETGEAALLYTPGGRYVVTNNIEAPRLLHEAGLPERGFQPLIAPWHKNNTAELIAQKTHGLRLGSDGYFAGATDLSAELARLRAHLLPAEVDRFRALGRLCAEAMNAAVQKVRRGHSENTLAALLAQEAVAREVWPIVDLVATDRRIFDYRHPLPTDKLLSRYAMLVLCGRRWGLVCSLTRLIHFGPLPDELRHKLQAVAHVDATLLAATRPGATLSQVFARGVAAYERTGFATEWQQHHQGGAAGYEPREYLGTPSAADVVAADQVFAWNPSITGVKSEDSILIGAGGNEVLTEIPSWPTLSVEVDGHKWKRPAILELRD